VVFNHFTSLWCGLGLAGFSTLRIAKSWPLYSEEWPLRVLRKVKGEWGKSGERRAGPGEVWADKVLVHQENSWPLSSTELYLEFLIK
jgi:hypothetical protein